MGLFKRKGGDAAVAEPPDVSQSTEGLLAEIDQLTAANRAQPDRDTERRLLRLRHLAGLRMLEATGAPGLAEPDPAALPPGDGLPEFRREELTPGLLRAAILRDGCALVRGLVDRDAALRFGEQIDRAFTARAALEAGDGAAPGLYEEFEPETRFEVASVRPWI